MSIKELYYCFKYRNGRGHDGPVGIFVSKKKQYRTIMERLDKIEKSIIPIYRNNDEVLEYIKTKFNLTEVKVAEDVLPNFKTNYIINRQSVSLVVVHT